MTASLPFVLLAFFGTFITTVQAMLTLRFRRKALQPADVRRRGSFISILKPVCGLDDQLEQNLVSFTRIRGLRYEVIISAESWDDPALVVAQRVMRAYPSAPFRLVVDAGSRRGVVNRKVERLVAAARVAQGEILVISDSNVRVEADDLARALEPFETPRVGCVSMLFTGAGAASFGATIESLHLVSFVVPGAVLASTAGVPCVVGKSMAISRRAYEVIGGFEPFRTVLAEDQAIGMAVANAGYEVLLSPTVVRNVIVERSLTGAIARQVRWNKIRFAFSRWLYAAELILNPIVFALAGVVVAPRQAMAIAALVMFARTMQVAILSRATNAGLRSHQIALTPVLDLVMFYAWLVPFFSNRVTWRGYQARIGRDTELIAA